MPRVINEENKVFLTCYYFYKVDMLLKKNRSLGLLCYWSIQTVLRHACGYKCYLLSSIWPLSRDSSFPENEREFKEDVHILKSWVSGNKASKYQTKLNHVNRIFLNAAMEAPLRLCSKFHPKFNINVKNI